MVDSFRDVFSSSEGDVIVTLEPATSEWKFKVIRSVDGMPVFSGDYLLEGGVAKIVSKHARKKCELPSLLKIVRVAVSNHHKLAMANCFAANKKKMKKSSRWQKIVQKKKLSQKKILI